MKKSDIKKINNYVDEACKIIECGDIRLMATDGPIGNLPPILSIKEWRRLYILLKKIMSLTQ